MCCGNTEIYFNYKVFIIQSNNTLFTNENKNRCIILTLSHEICIYITGMISQYVNEFTSWNVKSSGPYEASLSTKLVEVMEFQLSYKRWCCESATLKMPANLENSAVATGLEKLFSFQSQERQCQRMFKQICKLHTSHTLAK